ncbi:MAG: hypothetical protein HY535_02270 [Chloroflexi bacterium]|nr:hypothetical protein [Chloroflexota bacterium]
MKAGWGLAVGLALALLATNPAHAQGETTTVSGWVLNGTAGGGVPEATVSLQVVPEGQPPYAHGSVAADGSRGGWFAFEGVPLNPNWRYFVVSTYLGISYAVELASDSDRQGIRLTVYEATSRMDSVALATQTLLVLGANARDRILAVMEMAQVANKGDRVFIPEGAQGGMGSFLRFPLPPGAMDLEIETELPEGEALQVDRGFALTNPVPPGEYGVAFTYRVPYESAALDLSRSLPLGAGTFRLLVPRDVGTVAAGGLRDQGEVLLGARFYRVLSAEGLVPGTLLEVSLGGLPQPSLWQRLQKAFGLGSWAIWALPGAVATVLAGLLVVAVAKARPSVVVETAPVADPEALAVAIARWDDRFHRGELEEGAYRRHRQVLKSRLLRLAWQARAGAGGAEG